MSESKTFNMDCMEAMKKFPDKYFDLAVVDPPYGSADSDLGGGNYFGLPPNRHFLIWVKTNIPEKFSMGMCEYAWTNMGNENPKVFYHTSIRDYTSGKFHPTEKPIALYRWIFGLYAKPGDKILDTHLGSGSSRIAAYDMGLDFTGYELDPVYFRKQEERFED